MDFVGKNLKEEIKIKPKNNIDNGFHFWYNRKFNQK